MLSAGLFSVAASGDDARSGALCWANACLGRNSADPADLAVGARSLRGHLESMRPGRVT